MLIFPPNQVTAVSLGMMQDGGLPHIGCRCAHCRAAAARPAYAASLAIVDTRPAAPTVALIDATPDIKYQLDLLAAVLGPHPAQPARLRQPDALFLTHAHLGHIGGLPQLGPEAMAVADLPVYASAALAALLQGTALWAPLLAGLRLRPIAPGQPVALAPDVRVTATAVPHRDETGSGTFAYHVQGPARTLLYVPDIDDWAQWPDADAWLSRVDAALVDATFWSSAELGGRPPVAHPLLPDTLARFAHIPGQLVLTHL
ncbi:MAG: MBL fold metallo-hydrolase, partial [Anaerolineales bacterium]|nr:MBL fold metallo-hydrolase [Anaerolineales bacterium]